MDGIPEEQHSRFFSSLHLHIHMCTHIHECSHTHTHALNFLWICIFCVICWFGSSGNTIERMPCPFMWLREWKKYVEFYSSHEAKGWPLFIRGNILSVLTKLRRKEPPSRSKYMDTRVFLEAPLLCDLRLTTLLCDLQFPLAIPRAYNGTYFIKCYHQINEHLQSAGLPKEWL